MLSSAHPGQKSQPRQPAPCVVIMAPYDIDSGSVLLLVRRLWANQGLWYLGKTLQRYVWFSFIQVDCVNNWQIGSGEKGGSCYFQRWSFAIRSFFSFFYSWFGNHFDSKTTLSVSAWAMMIVCEEPAEQTAPSFMAVIKAAVGGRVWETGRKNRGGLVQDCHLVVWHA